MKYILGLDQGTSSSRALLFDEDGKIVASAQKEFTQYYPKSGWVEHDPEEIWESQEAVLKEAISKAKIEYSDILAIGITNQRETTVVWNADSGKAIYNAIVWQDKRTSKYCEELIERNLESYVRNTTGLVIDSYFSGTKINWILNNVQEADEQANAGKLRFGTIDSWLIHKMTDGKEHRTDYTNASRTMLFDIDTLQWDNKLLRELEIPASMIPRVQSSRSHFGFYEIENCKIPILGVAGDQQAALFGQCCFEEGSAKNTYGTGCFMLMNVGDQKVTSHKGLLTTLAANPEGGIDYALEGSVFIAGAAIQWLRDGLNLLDKFDESEAMALESTNEDVVVVPAFVGLGAPYWDMYARGAIFGITQDTSRSDIAKATLKSLAFQSKDVLEAMEKDSGIQLKSLKVDGGAVSNHYLMQFQADILNVPVERPAVIESTAQGAAYLAGLEAGLWDISDLQKMQEIEKVFHVEMSSEHRRVQYELWLEGVNRSRSWLKA
jgi:glycerol kinase